MRTVNDDGSGGGADVKVKWADINWTFTESAPTGFLTGFEVVLYTGTDPTVTNNYIIAPALVQASDRRLVTTYSFRSTATPANINTSVRCVYGSTKGPWSSTTSGASPANPVVSAYLADNLIPNPTSELGALVGYAGALVVNDPTNSYAGNYCRKLDASATNKTALTPVMSCVYGDQFAFDCYVKGTNGTVAAQLVVDFFNASGGSTGSSSSTPISGTAYAYTGVHGAVPAGTVGMQVSVQASTTGASQFLYFDNLSLRRSTRFSHMETDAGFRGLNAIKNNGITAADRAWYAGNNDPATRGGAPNISCLTITPQVWDTTLHSLNADFTLQPTAATDNLDGMRHAKVTLYKQSATGTTATLTQVGTPFYVPLKDRLFGNTTDSNSANASTSSGSYLQSGLSSGFPAMLVTIYNAFGPSDTHCFYAPAGWAQGTALTDNGTTWPAGITGGTAGGSGGGSGGGGSCVTPETMIDLPGGHQKRADALIPGDLVWTIHSTGTIGAWPVVAARLDTTPTIYAISFEGGLTVNFALNHRLRVIGKGWVYVQDIQPGDVVTGETPRAVLSIVPSAGGAVVAITVDQANSYQTSGLLSSNIKSL